MLSDGRSKFSSSSSVSSRLSNSPLLERNQNQFIDLSGVLNFIYFWSRLPITFSDELRILNSCFFPIIFEMPMNLLSILFSALGSSGKSILSYVIPYYPFFFFALTVCQPLRLSFSHENSWKM